MELQERPEAEESQIEHVAVSLETSNSIMSAIRGQRRTITLSEQESQQFLVVKEIICLVQENKLQHWLEGREDSISDARAATRLNHFLLDQTNVHSIWKDILEGNLESTAEWIGEVKAYGADIDQMDCNGLNALHYAIIFKQAKLVQILLDSGAGHDCPTLKSKLLPLQLAILGPRPFMDAMDLLCGYQQTINHCIEESKWGTALDLAVKEGSLEAVVMLLRYGANPGHCWDGRTTLERAIQMRSRPLVKAMLEVTSKGKGIDREILVHIKSCTSNDTRLSHGHAPFCDLVTELSDVAEVVLNHCIETKYAPHEENYEISFDCSLFENENSSANKCYRGLPCTCIFDIMSWFFSGRSEVEKDSSHESSIDCFNEKAYDSFEKYQHPLYRVMQSKDTRLLKHPMIQILLEQKLRKFGWLLYYANLLVYIVLVSLLTCFILLIPNPQSKKCLQIEEAKNASVDNHTTSSSICSVLTSTNRMMLLLAIKCILLALVILRSLIELYQLYSQKVMGYLRSWGNWIELAQCISISIFLIDISYQDCFCSSARAWEAGIVSLALTWVVLLVWLQTMHWIGIYVTIMLKIICSFVKVAIFGVLLIVAFGLSFYMLFYTPPSDAEQVGAFSSPLRSILAVIPLTAGDISMDSMFYSGTDEESTIGSQYQTLAFIIWFSSLIIMSVLFNNMLVGLAVGEVTNVIEKARITTIKQRIDLVLTLEEHLPECIHRQVIQKDPITVRPNTISASCYCLRVITQFMCVCCSAIFFNTNHFRYWALIFKPRAREPNKKFEDIQRLVEKARFNSSEEDECSRPVTREEVRVLLDDLKDELKYYDCVMQSLNLH